MAEPVYGQRGFEEIRITPLTDNTAEWKFDGWSAPYDVQYGRENLAALSHEYNLYFVAVGNVIQVTQPDVLYQRVAFAKHRGRFFIPPVGKSPGPFQSHRNPHGVNNLLIEKLGTIEVVLCACDDGTVAVYRTQDIVERMNSCSVVDKEGWLTIVPQPLFLLDMGQSAWGLAAHTQSRKIAISSNEHVIRVVCLGTTKASQLAGFECHVPEMLTLREHRYNIPTVSFLNSPEDPEGQWLVSADLSNESIVWNLSQPIRHSASIIKSRHKHSIFDAEHAMTWALTCIPPSCFQYASKSSDMWGVKNRKQFNPADNFDKLSSFDGSWGPLETLRLGKFRAAQSATSEYVGTVVAPPNDPQEGRIHDGLKKHLAQVDNKQWISETNQILPALNPPFAVFHSRGPDVFLSRPGDHQIAAYCEDAVFSQLAKISDLSLSQFVPPSSSTHMPYLIQIPELKLVVVGNTIGRVAVLTPTVRNRNSTAFKDQECQQNYGFRLDWTLPLPFENYGVKPNLGRCISHGPMIGLAASPMPDLELFENGDVPSRFTPRRWRLFLQFADGQTLCYGLERAAASKT